MSSDAEFLPPTPVGGAHVIRAGVPPQVFLTEDQRRILRLIAIGQSSGDVAAALSLPVTIVGRELARLRRVLAAPTCRQAAAVAASRGLLPTVPEVDRA